MSTSLSSAMASSSRIAGRTCSLFRQVRAPANPARSFTTRATARCLQPRSQAPASKNARHVRLFSSSAARRDLSENAPSAKAYLESGVLKGAANPVDVKKVLVIGSGGLAIGQAGEFDYSGQYFLPSLLAEMSHMEQHFFTQAVLMEIQLEFSLV